MPSGKQDLQDLIGSLEALLVNLFRLCESLFEITKEERQALLEGNIEVLMQLAKKKEAILGEMDGNEESRRSLFDQMIKARKLEKKEYKLSELLDGIDTIDTSQVVRLQQGILALQAEIREFNNGNYAMATLNLQRLDAVQSYILSLLTPANYYRPSIPMPSVEPPASWGTDRRA